MRRSLAQALYLELSPFLRTLTRFELRTTQAAATAAPAAPAAAATSATNCSISTSPFSPEKGQAKKMPTTLTSPEAAAAATTPSKPPIGPSSAAAAASARHGSDDGGVVNGGNGGGKYKRSDSSASLADADGACAGGVRDVSLPGQPLSRTRPLRAAAELGSAPTIWIPLLNRGTAFSKEDRRRLRLEGLLPPAVESLPQQAARVLKQLRDECSTPLERYARLAWLAASNVTLFYHVLMDNLEELAPVVYTPTVGEACQKFSAAYRTPQGMFFDARGDAGRFGSLLKNWPNHNVQIIVITDGSRILGLGDLGIGGLGISAGKIQLYVGGAGFHPEHAMPVILDAGTNRQELLEDPSYLGVREPRLGDEDHMRAVVEFCDAVKERFPDALVQFEDFQTDRAFAILEKCRDRLLCFNDDIQGTGAVVCAGFLNGVRAQGTPPAEARVVFYGAGSSAVGVAETIAAAVADDANGAITIEQARAAIFMVDSKGLITTTRGDALPAHKVAFARTDGTPDMKDLVEIVKHVKPHALVGLSGQGGAFTEPVLRELAKHQERPLVFPLSNPTSCAEVTAADAYAWTDGRAVFASGSPFAPVERNGVVHRPGQANNVFVFPGLGFGAVMSKASKVTDGMLLASARAVAAAVPDAKVAAGELYPPVSDLRAVSLRVAAAVAAAARDEGVARAEGLPRATGDSAFDDAAMREYIRARMWWPTGAEPEGWPGI